MADLFTVSASLIITFDAAHLREHSKYALDAISDFGEPPVCGLGVFKQIFSLIKVHTFRKQVIEEQHYAQNVTAIARKSLQNEGKFGWSINF
jgi:hypothetical protein